MSHPSNADFSVSRQLRFERFWKSEHGIKLTEKAHPEIVWTMANFENIEEVLHLAEGALSELLPKREDSPSSSDEAFEKFEQELIYGWTKLAIPAIRAFIEEEE